MNNPRNRSNDNISTISDSSRNFQKSQVLPSNSPENIKLAPNENPEVILVEPFYGGSHKQLADLLRKNLPNSHLITLPAKKWHWRARCSSLILSTMIPKVTTERVLFCSSVLNLAELLGLCPELCALKKIVYFHENQLVYPIREIKDRDIQFAYNQITTCLAADWVVFNSHYNKDSFLDNLKKVIKMLPDFRPKDIKAKIESKAQVLYFPLCFNEIRVRGSPNSVLRIVWPHRWEFDKDPDTFINVLLNLKCRNFQVVILGEKFTEIPEVFTRAQELLKDQIVHIGFVETKKEYYEMLGKCHVAISTAKHEFFGVSMLEASFCGCFPLVPKRLVYPEIYPQICLFDDENELLERLQKYCANPSLAEVHRKTFDPDFFNRFSADEVLPKYLQLLNVTC